MLEPNEIPNCIQPPPPPMEIKGELEYEVMAILDSKFDWRRRVPLQYLVKWAGYEETDEETSWLSPNELGYAQELVRDFHTTYPDKSQ